MASNKEQSAPGKTEVLRRDSSMNVIIIVGDGNAVQHGKATHVDIRLTARRDTVRLTISDNGCGLSAGSDNSLEVGR